ncbi:HdeD family acid-resistance protein [Amorphus sp. 3PC139-8]|uniref:HdeD family acid-resistance protein n=1 Tax=Amorphus sp. 3PC139-8 TaxID=2735676 RepID=UPI00345D08D0
MANLDVEKTARAVFGDLHRKWGWLLALGILMVVLGAVGLGMTYWLTVFAVIWFGILSFIGGIAQLFDAFKHKGWKSTAWHVLIGLIYLAAGVIMVGDPVIAAGYLTLFIAAALIVVGVMRIIMAFQVKGGWAWLWLAFAGAISILLGAMIYAQWPISGVWVIGLFVAIDLIFHGFALISIAFAARALPDDTGKGGTRA